MNIKELFEKAEGGVLTYEQFESLAKDGGAKFTDLSEGKYVSKSKYDTDIKAKDTQVDTLNGQIETLNGTIATRDTDLATLQKQLEDAGNDVAKLNELNAQFAALQTQYDNDSKSYQAKLSQQAYEFAVKEFANSKKFTSQAAKRDFIKAMTEKGLQMEGDKLIGGDDFVQLYSVDNADAFYVEPPKPAEPVEPPKPAEPVPTIVASAPGAQVGGNEDNGFNFNFTGVREHK